MRYPSDDGRSWATLVVAVAGNAVVGLHIRERGYNLVATFHLGEAAAGEAAAGRWVDWRGHVAFEDNTVFLGSGVDRRDGRQQCLRVRRQRLGV